MRLKILVNAVSGRRPRQRKFKIKSNWKSRIRQEGYDAELEGMMSKRKWKALFKIQPSGKEEEESAFIFSEGTWHFSLESYNFLRTLKNLHTTKWSSGKKICNMAPPLYTVITTNGIDQFEYKVQFYKTVNHMKFLQGTILF